MSDLFQMLSGLPQVIWVWFGVSLLINCVLANVLRARWYFALAVLVPFAGWLLLMWQLPDPCLPDRYPCAQGADLATFVVVGLVGWGAIAWMVASALGYVIGKSVRGLANGWLISKH